MCLNVNHESHDDVMVMSSDHCDCHPLVNCTTPWASLRQERKDRRLVEADLVDSLADDFS